MLAINRDITERIAAERRLRESEVNYRNFISHSSEAIYRITFDEPVDTRLPVDKQIELFYRHGSLAECNNSFAAMYGYFHAEELIGARIDDLMPMSDHANIEYLRAFIQGGYRITGSESCEKDRDGMDRIILNNLVGFVEDERVVQVWGTQLDITERRRAEVTLRESEERERQRSAELHAIMDAVPAAICIAHDPRCEYITGNALAHELAGVPRRGPF